MSWLAWVAAYLLGGVLAVTLEYHLALRRKQQPLTVDLPYLVVFWPVVLLAGLGFLFAWAWARAGAALYYAMRDRKRGADRDRQH